MGATCFKDSTDDDKSKKRNRYASEVGATALATGPLVNHGGAQCPSCFVGSEEGGKISHVNASTGEVISTWDAVHGRDINKLLYHEVSGVLFSASRDKLVKMIRVRGSDAPTQRLDSAAMTSVRDDDDDEEIAIDFEDDDPPPAPAKSLSKSASSARQDELRAEPIAFAGHTLNVTCITASYDGRHIASGSRDNSMRLWDVQTQQVLSVCDVKLNVIHCCQWLPEMNVIAQGGEDLTVKLWDVRAPTQMRLEHTLSNFDYHPICCDVVPDGTGVRLITGHNGFNNTGAMLTEWDLRMRRPLQYLVGHENTVRCVTCCEDGDRVFSVSDDGTVREWSLQTGYDVDSVAAVNNRDACLMRADFPEGRATAIVPLLPCAAQSVGQRVDFAVSFRSGVLAVCRHDAGASDMVGEMVRMRHLGFDA